MPFGLHAELVACTEGGRAISFYKKLVDERAATIQSLVEWQRMEREAQVEVNRLDRRKRHITSLLGTYDDPDAPPVDETPQAPRAAAESQQALDEFQASLAEDAKPVDKTEEAVSDVPDHDCQEYATRVRREATRATPLPSFPGCTTTGPMWIYACTVCDADLGDAAAVEAGEATVLKLVRDTIDGRPGRNWRVAEIAEVIRDHSAMKGRKPNNLRNSVKQACYSLAEKGQIRKLATSGKSGSNHRSGVAYRSTIQMSDNDIQWVRVSDDLEVAATPVTEAQYASVMGECPSSNGDNHPVVRVTWDEAATFCERIGARLPTEEEWISACGERPAEPIEDHGVFGQSTIQPVATKLPVNGIYDGHGLVWEWTSTEIGSCRVYRGGSWYSPAGYLRAAYRVWYTPGYRNDYLGFRPARTTGTTHREDEK